MFVWPDHLDLIDLSKADEHQLRELEQATGLFLLPFMPSIAAGNMRAEDRAARRFQVDLVRQGWFEVVSPLDGQPVRSGSSLVLDDKTTLLSFPDQPGLLIAAGDMSLGYPLCAAVLADRGVYLQTIPSDWGFGERHLKPAAEAIRESVWHPGPANDTLQILTGDANFAHHAWNQLSGLAALPELVAVRPNTKIVATSQPLGPIHQIFPELSPWQVRAISDANLPSLNAPGALFAPVGGEFITGNLVDRIVDVAKARISERCRARMEALSQVDGPVLWMSVRTRNRTATNQRDLLVALARSFLDAAPTGAVLIDGFSVGDDIEDQPGYVQDEATRIVERDALEADLIIDGVCSDGLILRTRLLNCVGFSISDSILLARRASIGFCHHGSVQHKLGWFSDIPSMVHCNRNVVLGQPATWVAAQSQIAAIPKYVPSCFIEDEESSAGGYSDLLNHGSYRIPDVAGLVSYFLEFSRSVGVLPKTNTYGQEDRPMGHPTYSSHSLDRHLIQGQNVTARSGAPYTAFFALLNERLRPSSYFEIGTSRGESLSCFTCNAVCIDPEFKLEGGAIGRRSVTSLFQMTSDEFFRNNDLRQILPGGPDIAFIDGLHFCEYALRDLMNTERNCHERSVIFLHDCIPANSRMAERATADGGEEEGDLRQWWTGDVWKIVPVLAKYRPDLGIFFVDCYPTGLIMITNPNPASSIFKENYSSIVAEMREMQWDQNWIENMSPQIPMISSHSLMAYPQDLTLFTG